MRRMRDVRDLSKQIPIEPLCELSSNLQALSERLIEAGRRLAELSEEVERRVMAIQETANKINP